VIVMLTVCKNVRRAFAAFPRARKGNVAITFALAVLPIIGAVGFAVDYSHANSVKAAMQSALDSTALMLAKEATTDTNTQLQADALKYFQALFNRPEAKSINISASYTASAGSQVVVNGSAQVPTNFLGIIGYQNITVNGSSTTAWGSSRLRVALVLDNTGSMADNGKITALKSATNSLLSQLQAAVTVNGDVYVSIIPFVKDVNLGSGNYNSNYIYWDDAANSDNNSWDANNGSCSSGYASDRASCVSQSSCSISGYNNKSSCNAAGTCSISGQTTQSGCTSASACSNSGQTTQSSCTGTKACSKPQYTTHTSCTNGSGTWGYGTWKTGTWTAGVWNGAYWTPKNHNTWNGCVMDRGYSTTPDTVNNYDTTADQPTASITSTLYPAEQYSACPQAAMGLSYNWSSMTSLVNAMSPNGNTNQAIGLQLGWLSLTGGGPFTAPAMDPNYQYNQIIILLTDGLNTQDRWYSSQNSIDARQQLTCDNIKAAGITLYTIQVNTGGDPTSTLLQNCASSSDKFYLLTQSSQIADVFTQIGTNLTKLRVAK
jgi:Flp pilus assembly protein TadG